MAILGKLLAMRNQSKELGATAAEYALLISGIAVVLVTATIALGTRLEDAYDLLTDILL